jgi:hypothetical protein
MREEKIPDRIAKILKEHGIKLDDDVAAKKAHLKRMEKLRNQVRASIELEYAMTKEGRP